MQTLLKTITMMALLASVARADHKPEWNPEVTLEELGFAFQEIEAGIFTMGSPDTEVDRDSDEKQVEVRIVKNYAMAATETTQRQWVLIMGENPSRFQWPYHCKNHDTLNGVELCPEHPVESVSWSEVQLYIQKLNALYNPGVDCRATSKTPKSGCFRLPTESEWEYAARGGTTTAYSFDNPKGLDDYGWYSGNSTKQARAVGQKGENPNRLYDMHGNVWEWVLQDRWRSMKFPLEDEQDSIYRVIRGGGWDNDSRYLRSANRSIGVPGIGYDYVGFRLVRTL